MSQSQGIEVRRPSRRTIASGAAWAVPVIAVGAAAPFASASPPPCKPEFQVVKDGSFKCCNTNTKNMKLKVKVVDVKNCLGSTASVCVTDVTVATPNDTIGQVVFEGGDNCVTENGTFVVYLLDVSNCTVNLLVTFTIDGGDSQVVPLKSGNISSGNTTGDCEPDA